MQVKLLIGIAFASSLFAATYTANDDPQLAEYIAEALDRNPSVHETLARYRAALLRLPQVAARPDPMLGLTQFARMPETRVGPQTTMVSISQRFPWFGKLSDREKVAAKEAAVIAQEHEAAKAEVVRLVKLAYYDLAFVDRAIEITEQDRELLNHFEILAQARYAQGIGLQQAAVKLQAEITRDRNQLEMLRRQRSDAEAVLNTLRRRSPDLALGPIKLSNAPPIAIDFATLYVSAEQNRPEIAAVSEQIEGAERKLHLAQREHLPDVTVGAGFTNVLGRRDPVGREMRTDQNGKNIYSLSVGVNLPIFRRKYDAGVVEATQRLIASKYRYRSVVNDAELSVRTIGFRLETIRRQIELFESALIPQAEQALSSTEAAYATAAVGVLDLLDSERMLLEVRLGLAQLQSDFMKSLAEMERVVGTAFPEVNK